MDRLSLVLTIADISLTAFIFIICLFRLIKNKKRREGAVFCLILFLNILLILYYELSFNLILAALIMFLFFWMIYDVFPNYMKNPISFYLICFLLILIVLFLFQIEFSIFFWLFYFYNLLLVVFIIQQALLKLAKRFKNKVYLVFNLVVFFCFLTIVTRVIDYYLDFKLVFSAINLLFTLTIAFFVIEKDYLRPWTIVLLSNTLFHQQRQKDDYFSQISELNANLAEQERFISLGILAGGLVHEFKNILSLISATTQFGILSETLEKKQESLKLISDHIQFSLSTVISILEQLKKGYSPEPKELSLKNYLMHFFKIVKANYRAYDLSLELEISKDFIVKIRQVDLEQILLNLIRNSAKALLNKQNGEIKKIKLAVKERGDKAIIEIEDNAGGIDEDLTVNLFTLQSNVSTSTGLGLYLTRLLAKQNNLIIEYYQTKEGSRFCLFFPD